MTPTPDPLAHALSVAREAALLAGARIREAWEAGRGAAASKATSIDMVTETDGAAEALIAARLKAEFPDDQLVLEEGGRQGGDGGRRWYVDPLDGTTNFAAGFPHFGVTMALEEEGEVVAGVVYDVTRGDLYEAIRGRGASVGGRPLRVSQAAELGQALLATGFPYDRWTNDDDNSAEHRAFLKCVRGVRRAGSASLDLAYVARGWLDGYWEMRLNPWDVAAGALLVSEAGGRVSAYDGAPLDVHGGRYVASNGRLHDALLSVLARARTAP